MDDLLLQLQKRVLIGDGAMGTEFMKLGAKPGYPSELLNIDEPDIVRELHGKYIEAGSDLILTNTFGANSIKFSKTGLGVSIEEINIAAAHLAREAARENTVVAGDIGPTGQMLKPLGDGNPAEILSAYIQQAKSLAEGGVDIIILETFFDLAEAQIALEAALMTDLPVIVSMTYECTKRGVYTMMGQSAAQCAGTLIKDGATMTGANCSVTIDSMIEVVNSLRQGADPPYIIQPNAGKPEVVGGETIYHEKPEQFAAAAPDLIEKGARILGGCCGTNPHFIRALKRAVE